MEDINAAPPPDPSSEFKGISPSEAVNPLVRKPNQKISHEHEINPKEISVDRVEAINQDTPKQEQRRQKGKKKEPEAKAGQHFESLAKAAEEAHKVLEKSNSPYRFCVFKRDDKVLIDLIKLGPDGKIQEEVEKDITREEFSNWIQHIMNQEGLFFDQRF